MTLGALNRAVRKRQAGRLDVQYAWIAEEGVPTKGQHRITEPVAGARGVQPDPSPVSTRPARGPFGFRSPAVTVVIERGEDHRLAHGPLGDQAAVNDDVVRSSARLDHH